MFSKSEKAKGHRATFTEKEDEKLKMLVQMSGKDLNWKTISFEMNGRTARQCRERYNNYLHPRLHHTEWKPEEDQTILIQFNIVGSHWQKIASYLPGRTGNAIRNRYYSLIRQKSRGNQSNSNSETTTDTDSENRSDVESPVSFINEIPLFDIPSDSIFYQTVESY